MERLEHIPPISEEAIDAVRLSKHLFSSVVIAHSLTFFEPVDPIERMTLVRDHLISVLSNIENNEGETL